MQIVLLQLRILEDSFKVQLHPRGAELLGGIHHRLGLLDAGRVITKDAARHRSVLFHAPARIILAVVDDSQVCLLAVFLGLFQSALRLLWHGEHIIGAIRSGKSGETAQMAPDSPILFCTARLVPAY